jgi:hypothetical protein
MGWRRLDPNECQALAAAPDFERLDAHAIWACITDYRGYQRPPGTRLPVALELTPDISALERQRIAELVDVPALYAQATERFWTGWVDAAKLPLLSARPGVARWRFGIPQNRKPTA